MREPSEIIVGPVISEKSIDRTATNQYSFWVTKKATKKEIAKSVENKFNVEVLETKVINIRGKKVRFGKSRKIGTRQDRRKGVVIVKPGQKIELFDISGK